MLRDAAACGGIGEYTRNIVRALLRCDRTSEYLLVLAQKEDAGLFEQTPHAESVVSPARSRLLWDQVVVPRIARARAVDLIFNPKVTVPLVTAAKTVAMLHGADWIAYPDNYSRAQRAYHAVALPAYGRAADGIIVASRDTRKRFVEKHPWMAPKCVAIHHGLAEGFAREQDADRLEAVRTRLSLPEHYLLFFSRIYPMKNLAGVLRAFARLRHELPHKLVIVGKPLYKAERELALIDQLELHEVVRVLGEVEDADKAALYSLADALVMPSLYEGFGIPLLEAMACGCPVVTSTAGSCPEVAGDAAVLVDPTADEAIAAGVRRVLQNSRVASELREKGYRRVRSFTWAKAAEQTLAFFERVVAGRRAPALGWKTAPHESAEPTDEAAPPSAVGGDQRRLS